MEVSGEATKEVTVTDLLTDQPAEKRAYGWYRGESKPDEGRERLLHCECFLGAITMTSPVFFVVL